MARSKERNFLTELKRSFQDAGWFAYKISDLPHFAGSKTRFDAEKPFDMIAVCHGVPIAIEAKVLTDFKAFGTRHLRPCQVQGLDAFSRAGGRSFVFLNVRRAGQSKLGVKRVNRLLVFDWMDFKKRCEGGTIKKKELAGFEGYDGSKHRFPIAEWIEDGL